MSASQESTEAPKTRFIKRRSENRKITLYVEKKKFVDRETHVDPVEGVVVVDPEYVKYRKLICQVSASFQHRRDLDVLGLMFQKDHYSASQEIYPPDPEIKRPLTKLHKRYIKKFGPDAYPFFFELPPHGPAPVTLQSTTGDKGKSYSVDYELKAFVSDRPDEKVNKWNSARLTIKKIMYVPSRRDEQPSTEVSKEFVMPPYKLHLEASVDKELPHHGEDMAINIHITNNSEGTVKKIEVPVRLFPDISMHSTAEHSRTVAEIKSEDGCPNGPALTLSKVYYFRPLSAENKDKQRLALESQLKDEDTNSASSSTIKEAAQKEDIEIIVQYKEVKVNLCLRSLDGFEAHHLPLPIKGSKNSTRDGATGSKNSTTDGATGSKNSTTDEATGSKNSTTDDATSENSTTDSITVTFSKL